MATIKIVLPADTPYYSCRDGETLIRKDSMLTRNTPICVGRIENRIFGRAVEEALPFHYFGETCYVLLRQLQIAGIKRRLRAFSNLHLVEKNTAS